MASAPDGHGRQLRHGAEGRARGDQRSRERRGSVPQDLGSGMDAPPAGEGLEAGEQLGPDKIAAWPRVGIGQAGMAAARRRRRDKPLSGQRDPGPRVSILQVAVLQRQALARPESVAPQDRRLTRRVGAGDPQEAHRRIPDRARNLGSGPREARAQEGDEADPDHQPRQRQPSTGTRDGVGPAAGARGPTHISGTGYHRGTSHGLSDGHAPARWWPRVWPQPGAQWALGRHRSRHYTGSLREHRQIFYWTERPLSGALLLALLRTRGVVHRRPPHGRLHSARRSRRSWPCVPAIPRNSQRTPRASPHPAADAGLPAGRRGWGSA